MCESTDENKIKCLAKIDKAERGEGKNQNNNKIQYLQATIIICYKEKNNV